MNSTYFCACVRPDQLANFKACLEGLPVGHTKPPVTLHGDLHTSHLYYLEGPSDIMSLLQDTGIRCAERTPDDSERLSKYLV